MLPVRVVESALVFKSAWVLAASVGLLGAFLLLAGTSQASAAAADHVAPLPELGPQQDHAQPLAADFAEDRLAEISGDDSGEISGDLPQFLHGMHSATVALRREPLPFSRDLLLPSHCHLPLIVDASLAYRPPPRSLTT